MTMAGGGEPIAAGRRVLLREPTADDEAGYCALRAASEAFLAPWEPLPPEGEGFASASGFRRLVAAAASPRHIKTLAFRVDDGRLVGAVNANEVVLGCFRSAFLGYWIGAPFARQGLMSEALALMISHAFGALGLHRLEANVQPDNAASLALVRRVGFRREGLSPRYLEIAGRWADHERWAITAEEWSR